MLLLAARGLLGGCLVVMFALVGEVVKPKVFAGLFASAPSVALASLLLTIGFESVYKAREESIGMVVGAIAMTASAVVAAACIPRMKALWGSLAAWVAWAAVALGLYWAVFVGAR